MSTQLDTETRPVNTGDRPVHIPWPSDPYLGLCGSDLSNAVWSTRMVECPECLVLNELFNLNDEGDWIEAELD